VKEEGETISLETQEVEEEEEVEVECKVIGVLGSMGEYNTMKIGGKLENIDWWYSGASHNAYLLLQWLSRRIKLGDDHKVMSQGVCKGVSEFRYYEGYGGCFKKNGIGFLGFENEGNEGQRSKPAGLMRDIGLGPVAEPGKKLKLDTKIRTRNQR
jgi:hypothetical protein